MIFVFSKRIGLGTLSWSSTPAYHFGYAKSRREKKDFMVIFAEF